MRRGRLLTLLLVLALASAGLAHAQAPPAPPLPLGTDGHGVRLVQGGRPAQLVVRLSSQRQRKLAGARLDVVCAPVPRVTLGGGTDTGARHDFGYVPRPPGSVHVHLRVPRRRAPLATGLSPRWDYCVLSASWRVANGVNTMSFATVPLTRAGAAFADERRVAATMIVTVELARSKRWATHVPRLARMLDAVVLSSPAELPPPQRLGLYGDGAGHVYAAETDRAGELLFLERDGDVTRTNLLRYLQDDSLLWGAYPRP